MTGRRRGRKIISVVAVGLMAGGLVAGSAVAQGFPGSTPSGSRPARVEKSPGVIQGKLTRVDGRSESVDVSIGFLGLLGKTLEVNQDTVIQVNGQEARFADLHEGAKVIAFYQERGAKLVATRLEVTTGA